MLNTKMQVALFYISFFAFYFIYLYGADLSTDAFLYSNLFTLGSTPLYFVIRYSIYSKRCSGIARIFLTLYGIVLVLLGSLPLIIATGCFWGSGCDTPTVTFEKILALLVVCWYAWFIFNNYLNRHNRVQ